MAPSRHRNARTRHRGRRRRRKRKRRGGGSGCGVPGVPQRGPLGGAAASHGANPRPSGREAGTEILPLRGRGGRAGGCPGALRARDGHGNLTVALSRRAGVAALRPALGAAAQEEGASAPVRRLSSAASNSSSMSSGSSSITTTSSSTKGRSRPAEVVLREWSCTGLQKSSEDVLRSSSGGGRPEEVVLRRPCCGGRPVEVGRSNQKSGSSSSSSCSSSSSSSSSGQRVCAGQMHQRVCAGQMHQRVCAGQMHHGPPVANGWRRLVVAVLCMHSCTAVQVSALVEVVLRRWSCTVLRKSSEVVLRSSSGDGRPEEVVLRRPCCVGRPVEVGRSSLGWGRP